MFYMSLAVILCVLLDALLASPNIIFIFADDLGRGDIGYQGSDIKTPNIDKLARSGVILNQHYVLPQCSPSRAAFMTGRYPIHTGFHNANIVQGELWGLGLDEFTIGEMFQEYGYKTHAIGKWHLGWRTWRHTPVHRGFDSFLGFYFCAHDHYEYSCGLGGRSNDTETEPLIKDDEKEVSAKNKQVWGQRKKGAMEPRRYSRNKKTELFEIFPDTLYGKEKSREGEMTPRNARKPKAADKVPTQEQNRKKYFDLRENYFNESHDLVDDIRWDLKGQYSANVFTDATIDRIKTRGEEPMFIYLNYMNVHSPYQAPRSYVKKYTSHMNGTSTSRKIYAAMVSSIDEGIGNITETLKEEGIYNDTIIVFASDNGANVGSCRDDVLKYDNTPHKMEPGSNYPLRGGKRSLYEGGVKSVSFVHSPLLKSSGREMDSLMHVVDWFDTFEDIISNNGRISPQYKIKDRLPRDSISAWKAINRGSSGKRKKFLLNINTKGGAGLGKCGAVSQPFKGIRKNQWKLLIGGGGEPSGWYNPYSRPIYLKERPEYIQLYNIKIDPAETLNLASNYPAIVIDLLRELREHKSTIRSSIRRKKIDLGPYLQGNVPTPLKTTDPRNKESHFADKR